MKDEVNRLTKGARIKKLRQRDNFTLDEIADKLGTSRQTIFKYENDIVTNIPSDKIEQLALIFNVTPAYIMGWENREKANGDSQSRIWKNVKYFRESKNISVEELAECSGLSVDLINSIESNTKIPSYEVLVKLSKILNCEVSHLFLGDDLEQYDMMIIEKIDDIMSGKDEARKKVIKAAIDFNDENILLLEKIIDALNAKKAD